MSKQILPFVLASSSPYRHQLLRKLGIDCIVDPPNINETAQQNENGAELATRLAQEKAEAISERHPVARIIASDQVLSIDDQLIGKPLSTEKAFQQLSACAGKTASFFTSVYLINNQTGMRYRDIEETKVSFRALTERQIRRYIELEPALNCAGSFKVEGLGISLIEAIHSDDPNSLIGLPLIKLISLLNEDGYQLL